MIFNISDMQPRPFPPLEEGDRVVTHTLGNSTCRVPLRGTVTKTWNYGSWEHADVMMDSGEQRTFFVGNLVREPPLETLAHLGRNA